MTIAIALIIATAIPLAVLAGIYKLDLYKTGEFKYMLAAFGAGGVAYLSAALINMPAANLLYPSLAPVLNPSGSFPELAIYYLAVQFVAPTFEEILKGLILFFLVRRKNFTYFVDGAIYGFAAGIGFAIFENFEYVLGHPNAALAVAINRVISTNLMHAAATATLGIILGLARFQKPARQTLTSVGGLLLAMLFHIGFNNLVTRVESGWLLLYAVAIGGGAAGFIFFMIKRGLAVEKKWIGQTLGITDRVERGEVTAVQNIDKVNVILARLDERLGPDKGAMIKKLLVVQAKLGIQRKAVSKMEDKKMRLAHQEEADALRKEMEVLRRQIGAYAMVYVRDTHLEELLDWQSLLADRLEQTAQLPKPSGPSMYDRLGGKLASTDKKSDS
jgi:RsiW-degrading membrane proteinase PrsW (M82 family)